MSSKSNKRSKLSRRRILPILGGGLLFPFLGFSKSNLMEDLVQTESNDDFQILLRSDGTTVKVRKNDLKSATIVQKNTSTKTMLKWINKKV